MAETGPNDIDAIQSDNACKIHLTPQAPGSIVPTMSSLRTYADRPALASILAVSLAARSASVTPCFTDLPARRAETNAAKGSTKVLLGGLARVYVRSLSKAEDTASLQTEEFAIPSGESARDRP